LKNEPAKHFAFSFRLCRPEAHSVMISMRAQKLKIVC
jgi:hypothetical protein